MVRNSSIPPAKIANYSVDFPNVYTITSHIKFSIDNGLEYETISGKCMENYSVSRINLTAEIITPSDSGGFMEITEAGDHDTLFLWSLLEYLTKKYPDYISKPHITNPTSVNTNFTIYFAISNECKDQELINIVRITEDEHRDIIPPLPVTKDFYKEKLKIAEKEFTRKEKESFIEWLEDHLSTTYPNSSYTINSNNSRTDKLIQDWVVFPYPKDVDDMEKFLGKNFECLVTLYDPDDGYEDEGENYYEEDEEYEEYEDDEDDEDSN